MEHAPQPHHRDGIQNDLDKAYDEGHSDNKAFDEAQAKIAEIKEDDIARKEYGDIGDKEARGKLSLEETVALLKEEGLLVTSFEGKETHPLALRALSKEDAIAEYCSKNGEDSGPWPDVGSDMPYVAPEAGNLDVIIVNFDQKGDGDDVVSEMEKFGVRPLTYAELIQYGIAYPSHQEQVALVAFGTKAFGVGGRTHPLAPALTVNYKGEHMLAARSWGVDHDNTWRFLVVRK